MDPLDFLHKYQLMGIQSNDFLRKIWAPRKFMSAGGFTKDLAVDATNANPNELVAFGRHFIANVRAT